MTSFRLTLQSPFIENEDADIRIRIETRTTDWSMLERCGISDVGEYTTTPFMSRSSCVFRSPELHSQAVGGPA